MARSVRVGDFQRMQRAGKRGPNHVALGESEAAGNAADGNGHDVATADPMTGQLVDAKPPLTVPQQLAAMEIHATAGSAYADVVKRIRTRCTLLDIPAIDEEIAAEARRRCGMLPEPTAKVEADDDEPVEDPLADLLHGSDDSDYPVVADVPCDECGGDVVLRSEEEDHELASRVAEGVEIEVLCDTCAAAKAPVEPMAEDQADREPTIADELQSLNLEARCTAEMSLHMITERVREATDPLGWLPITDADIVAEAERIWVSLDRQRSHTYSVEQDGTIRDWRRPDTTPDRGDVTAVHTITDDEPRFSGAGAEDGQQASMFLVPADAAFNGRQYRDAPELANIAEKLIAEHGFLQQLENCDVRWYWKRKSGVSKGRVKIGFMKRASDLLGHFSGADFIGWLSATTARDGKFTDRQVEAAVFHQLLHIGADDKGNWIFAPHDFEGFAQEVRHYGTWTSDLKIGGTAFVAAHQMGLFTEDEYDDEGEEIDDGAGVLIHDDGTPLTADEIAEMERAELNDDPAEASATGGPCSLCEHEIAAEDFEGTYCNGCGAHVCGLHVGDPPFGPHEQQDHVSADDFDAEYRLDDDAPADPDGPAPDEDGSDPLADSDL